jgi:hypothetical protein
MMDPQQSSWLLTLHAVRLLGFADTEPVAERFGQDPHDVERVLLRQVPKAGPCAPHSGDSGAGP